jgi:predicted phosphodiesterase
MRIALISDIHAETGRLETALSALKKEGYDECYCLGDTVEESPPKEKETLACTDIVREKCKEWILGNHDAYALRKRIFSSQRITEYLSDALIMKQEKGIILAHIAPSWPCSPHTNQYIALESYIETPPRAAIEFEQKPFDVAFIGHTHKPAAFDSTGSAHYFARTEKIKLNRQLRWLVSVGAVGNSRDSNKAASCAIYDDKKRTLTVLRI